MRIVFSCLSYFPLFSRPPSGDEPKINLTRRNQSNGIECIQKCYYILSHNNQLLRVSFMSRKKINSIDHDHTWHHCRDSFQIHFINAIFADWISIVRTNSIEFLMNFYFPQYVNALTACWHTSINAIVVRNI